MTVGRIQIRFCACAKGSASPPENTKHRESSKSCKSCGGKLPVDGRGSQSGSMLSTIGPELSRVIDPHLTWKTATNGRQRAVRKARTSFTGANRKKSTDKSSKESEDLTDKDSKNTGDMPVSESEKLGVSILGRRFSDTLGSVPIKKRRFLLVHSPSPPHHSSSHSDSSDHILESKPATYHNTALNAKQHPNDINSGCGMEFGQERNFADEKTDLEEVNEKICDAADFSGISILAAAACDSNIGGDFMNAEGSVSKGHSSEGQGVPGKSAKLHFLSEEKEELLPHTSDDLVGRTDLPLEISASSSLPCKESNEVKADGSCNLEKSVNSLQSVPNKTTKESTRDVRFHWDLNTVMDVWESHDDEGLNSEPHAANIVGEDGEQDKKLGNVEPCQGQVGFGDTKNVSELVDSVFQLGAERKSICALEEIKMEEKPGVSSDKSTAGDNESKHCFSHPRGDAAVPEEHQLEVATIPMPDVSEEIDPLCNKGKSCSVSGYSGDFPSSVGGASVPVGASSLSSAAALKEEKAEARCISSSLEVKTETSSSHLVSCESASVDPTTHACEPHHGADQRIMEAVYVENAYPASVADHDNRSADCCLTQMAQFTHIRSPQAEKHESLCIGSGTVKTDRHSLVSHLAEKASDVLIVGNIGENMVIAGAISGENANVDALDETDCDSADKSKEGVAIPCVGECETTAAEMKVDDNRFYVLTDENLNSTQTNLPTYNGSKVSLCNSTGMTPGNADAPPPDGVLSSQGPCKIYTDGYASSPGQVALEDHLDCNYYSDASQNDAGQAIGMEKVEFLGDDDSQYEDGEFRASVVNCWLEDGGEEGETECVDYGSDRETDIYEAASDFPASVSLHVDNGGLSDASHDLQLRTQVEDTQDAVSQPFPNCLSIADVSDAGAGKRNVGSVAEKGLTGHGRIKDGSKCLVRDLKDTSEFGAGNDKVIGDNGFLNEDDGARETTHSASFRMKMSGWDQLPGGCRSSGDEVTDCRVGSISRNHNGASLDPSGAGESVRRVVGSSLRRDLSSRVERVQSSDGSLRKDKSYVRASRSNERSDFNLRVERDTDAPRSIKRSGSSLHLQGRGRGDRSVDSPNHHGNNRHDSSGYCGPASFKHPGSRNAAAAAVAKVESNGFVVAPDGTIVKAGGVGPAGCLARRSAKASSQSNHRSHMGRGSSIERDGAFGMPPGLGHSREMSPDRPMFVGRGRVGRYGPGMVGIGHRERYRGLMPDDIIDSSSSMHHPISRRDHSFSPHRRPLHLSRSHSGSPSRSRTRSPRRWASPRGRSESGMNGGPGLQRRSRSPQNFKSEARMQRRPRPGFGEHIVSYAPSSRNHTSPQHSSRWIDGRKELPDHFREQEYKRCPGRSPPARVFSRGHRFDLMDSPGRLKPDEYHRPMNSGRFPEFVGFGRGSRHDGTDEDRRGHGDRYEMPYSGRQYDNDDNMKRFRYDIEDGFRAHNPRPRSSEFQQGESPRAFDRGIERQLGDSPRRAKEEKGHFRHGRDGKHNASFKSFGVRDGDDNMDARRRPS